MSSSNYLRYRWTSIWLCFGTFLGIIFVIWFSVADNLNAGVLLLWSIAYLVIGGLVGFIFSVPKIITDNNTPATVPPVQIPAPSTPATGIPVANVALSASPAPLNQNTATATLFKNRVQENTNLTEISDWLTKILIGAGLVQVREVPGFIHHIAIVMGSGLSEKGNINATNMVSMMCAAIILYFITWGFICGYLVMKLILTEQFVSLDDEDNDAP